MAANFSHFKIHRVPLDFHKHHQPGNEYGPRINPYKRKCPVCEGCKTTAAMRYFRTQIIDTIVRHAFDRTAKVGSLELQYAKYAREILTILTGQNSFPENSRDCKELATHQMADVIVDKCNFPPDWGKCPACEGDGLSRTHQQWTPPEIPKGKGWQIWGKKDHNTPLSPVLPSAPDLTDWCISNSKLLDFHALSDKWLSFIHQQHPEQPAASDKPS